MDLKNKTDKEKVEEVKKYVENLDIYLKLKECIGQELYLFTYYVKDDDSWEVRIDTYTYEGKSKQFTIFWYLYFCKNDDISGIGCLYSNKKTEMSISLSVSLYANQIESYIQKSINALYNYSIDNKDYVFFE